MNDWAGGYVSDIEYVTGFYNEQSPANLDMNCLICGVEPPRRPGSNSAFTYCEIGCGQGVTVTALAAANPLGKFHAIDFMPAHIARAEAFRARVGVENVTFHEADVAELADGTSCDLPQFDYVTMHGVYSWVSLEVRAGIVRFLHRYLKPGGAVLVTYNAQPAWANVHPMQKLLFESAASLPRTSDERVRKGIEFVSSVMEAGSVAIARDVFDSFLTKKPGVRTEEEHKTYLAHEFLNGHWMPLFHIDVARDFAKAKLGFVGSAVALENFAGFGLPEKARKLLDDMPDGPFRETMKDFFNGRGFRRDVFVRGRRTLTPTQREAQISEVMLAQKRPRPRDTLEAEAMSAKVTLNPAVYGPVLDALERRPMSIRGLLDNSRDAGAPVVSGTEVLGMMVGGGFAFPLLQDVTSDGVEACLRHNREVMRDVFLLSRTHSHSFAVPVGHSGVTFSALEASVIEGLNAGVPGTVDALSAHVIARSGVDPQEVKAESHGVASSEGATDAGEDTRDDMTLPMGARVERAVRVCLSESLPVWRGLGLLKPADPG